MTTYYLCPVATILQYFSDAGIVLNGGKVTTFLAGTSTPQATYTDSTGGTPNANPITLNSAGRLPNVSIWQAQGIKLKIVITDASNNQIGSPIDQVAGINDSTDLLSTLASNSVGSGADLIANAMRSFDLISSVRAAGAPTLVAGQTRVIDIQAGTTPDDGFGGLFYWSASSSATDDGINVIKPTSVSGNGRYLRQVANASGSFLATLTDFTNSTTLTLNYYITNSIASVVFRSVSNVTIVSAGTSMVLSGVPSILSSGNALSVATAFGIIDSGTTQNGTVTNNVAGSGQLVFGLGFNGGLFTAAGNKGISKNFNFLMSLR